MITLSPADPSFIATQMYISTMASNGSLFAPGGKTPLYSACSLSGQPYDGARTSQNLASFLGLLQGQAGRMEGLYGQTALAEVTQLEVLTEKMRDLGRHLPNASFDLEEYLFPRVGVALVAFRAPNPDDRVRIYFEFDHAAIAARFARETFPEG